MPKTAVLIGATGATGAALLPLLLEADAYDCVQTFTRRPISLSHPKLEAHVVDFSEMAHWSDLSEVDDVFLVMGTTLKQAGSRAAQYEVDFTFQAEFAKLARACGAKRCFIVSSPGADPNSRNFYLRIKGELDEYVRQLGYQTIVFKPSLIKARRSQPRMAEQLGCLILPSVCRLPGLSQYRPIEAEILARAIAVIATQESHPRAEYILSVIHDIAASADTRES